MAVDQTAIEEYLAAAFGTAPIDSPPGHPGLASPAHPSAQPFPLANSDNTMNPASYAHPGMLGHSTPQHTPSLNGSDKKPQAKGGPRSSMACTTCRRGKMRCEGPPGPCRRCAANGHHCTFEMGVGTANRAARAVESTGGIPLSNELDLHSPARAGSMSESPRPLSALPPGLHHSHEQRIASLETELATIRSFLHQQFSNASTNLPATSPSSYNNNSYLAPSPGAQGQAATQWTPQNQAVRPQLDGYGSARSFSGVEDDASRRMTVSSGSSLLLNPGPATMHDGRGQKRSGVEGFDPNGRGAFKRLREGEFDPTMDDFITRGEIAEDEAQLCFDSYLATLNTPPSPQVPQIDMSFARERQRSPLLLATLVAIGARAISHTTSYSVSLREATRLARLTVLNSASPTDLKALMLLSSYTGQSGLCGLVAEKLGQTDLPKALLMARDLAEELKGSDQARILVRQGRTFLVFCIWAALYTFNLSRPPLFPWSAEVLLEQARVLRESPFSEPTLDLLINAHIEMASYSYKAFAQLGDGIRISNPTADETIDLVESLATEAREWAENNRDKQQLLNGWGDEDQIRQVIPYHHIRLNLVFYSVKAIEQGTPIADIAKAREHVRLGIESALLILRFGTESRLWLPHSSSAQYYRAWKIPETLRILFRCVRLMPEETHFDTIRGVLERFAAHLDRSMTPLSTAHEVRGAHEMRVLVQEFRGWLDEEEKRGGGGPRWDKSRERSREGTGTGEEGEREGEVWDDDSLEKSLALLRLDTALFGCVFLEDE